MLKRELRCKSRPPLAEWAIANRACISNDGGYIVKVWIVTGHSNNPYCPEYGRFVNVVRFASQSDAMEFRDLIKEGKINESRLKLLIKYYNDQLWKIEQGVKSSNGEPVLVIAEQF